MKYEQAGAFLYVPLSYNLIPRRVDGERRRHDRRHVSAKSLHNLSKQIIAVMITVSAATTAATAAAEVC